MLIQILCTAHLQQGKELPQHLTASAGKAWTMNESVKLDKRRLCSYNSYNTCFWTQFLLWQVLYTWNFLKQQSTWTLNISYCILYRGDLEHSSNHWNLAEDTIKFWWCTTYNLNHHLVASLLQCPQEEWALSTNSKMEKWTVRNQATWAPVIDIRYTWA